MSTLTLFVDSRHISPWAMSAYVVLQEKGLDFEVRAIDIDVGEQHRGEYAALSPIRRVPLLLEGDFALAESTAIAEYLEAQFPAPAVYPQGLQTLARARELQAWIRSDLGALRTTRSTEVVFEGQKPKPLDPPAREAAGKLIMLASGLVGSGAGNLFGDWSIADADLALMLQRIAVGGDPLPEPLAHYVDRQWSRPSLVRWRARGEAAREQIAGQQRVDAGQHGPGTRDRAKGKARTTAPVRRSRHR
jgi:glutathione S-transferase